VLQNIQHIIEQKRDLIVRESFSHSTFDCSEDMLEDRKSRYTSYLGAVNYLSKFWNKIFAYLKVGNYPIFNLMAFIY
jgi:hypothetical protein